MNEFNIAKLIRFFVIAVIFMSVLRACTFMSGGGPGGYYGGQGYYGGGGGGGGFFTGMLMGSMLNRGGGYEGRNVRRGSFGRSRGGGFGFGK